MPGSLIVALYIIAAIALVGVILKLLGVRDNRFRKQFCKAFGFHAPLRSKYDRSLHEDQVVEKVLTVGVALTEARINFEQCLQPPGSPEELAPVVAISGGLSRVVERKEREYRQLRRLARRAGYSLNWLEQIHRRALDIASDPRAASAL